MSYSCYISFKKMPASEMLPFFAKLKEFCTSRLVEIARDNHGYCPFMRRTLKIERDWNELDPKDVEEAVLWARTSVFSFKYFYDAKHGYLGMFGVPTEAQGLFDKTVYFQNSCDQNYDLEEWRGVELFEKIYNRWMSRSDKYIAKYYSEQYDGDQLNLENPENAKRELLYYRQTFAYQEIWDMFSSYLFDENQSVFCSLYGPYNIWEMRRFVKYCHDAHVEWEKQFDT